MIESVQVQQIVESGAQETGGAHAPSMPASAPEEHEVQRFEMTLDGGAGVGEASSSPASPPQAEQLSPGERILQSLDAQREAFVHKMQDIEATLGAAAADKEVSPAELIGVQWKVQQTALELQISTKVVEKSNEGISTLLKNQG